MTVRILGCSMPIVWKSMELRPGKYIGSTVAPELRMMLAMWVFHAGSTTRMRSNMKWDTSPDGKVPTQPSLLSHLSVCLIEWRLPLVASLPPKTLTGNT
ncbi:MAG: hypothetical protein BWY82_02817 [Verrucomicrobia bacterium ADurb.Bin474]|nr:MAG: hypothetical protein BWY82_02817 [Verrucomicrobia bacterium ADurb.Bin474]